MTLHGLDLWVFEWFHSLSGISQAGDIFIVICASGIAYLLVVAALLVPLFLPETHITSYRGKWEAIIYSFISAGIARFIITPAIRWLWPVDRPFVSLNFTPLLSHEASASFPSGHAVFFFALAVSLWFYDRRFGMIMLALVAIMSMARVAAGIHWPSDIIAGAVIGAAVAYLISSAKIKLLPR